MTEGVGWERGESSRSPIPAGRREEERIEEEKRHYPVPCPLQDARCRFTDFVVISVAIYRKVGSFVSFLLLRFHWSEEEHLGGPRGGAGAA